MIEESKYRRGCRLAYERGRDHERMKILNLLREQAEFWKEWEYPEEYIFAVDVLLERLKCKLKDNA